MKVKVACPNRNELEKFAFGNAPVKDAARLQRHVNECEACRDYYLSISAPTTANQAPIIPNMMLSGEAPSASTDGYSFLLPPVLPDEIGRLGSYRVLRLLGQGGMGYVFLAEDIQLARPVALKVMKPDSRDPESGQRFLREARAMAAIKHENLVTIYQAGQEGNAVYFAMELLEGQSLESWIRAQSAPGLADILRIAREIAVGLAFIHRKNMVHRDIKPANIWLEAPNGEVKILDLGLVRPLDDPGNLTMTGMIMGTPEFMAPEQARGGDVDARADIFSLGSVLYYLCTKRKPFQGATSVAVLMALASETPTSVHELNPRLPMALSDLVMQMMAQEPRLRPASVAEVVKRLEMIERKNSSPDEHAHGEVAADETDTTLVTPVAPPNRRKTTSAGSAGVRVAVGLAMVACFMTAAIVGTALLWIFRGSLFPDGAAARPDGEPVKVAYLSEMKEVASENWPFRQGPEKEFKKKGPKDGPKEGLKDFDGPVRHNGKVLPRGIFMHPPAPPNVGDPASLSYRLEKKYASFEAEVSLRDGPGGSETPCVFWVFGDGKELWKSKPVATQQDAQKCVVSVKGIEQLKIAVTCAGLPHGAHAIWIDPQLSK